MYLTPSTSSLTLSHMPKRTTPASHISAVRSFNRFYTKQIGILHTGYLQTPFSLAEVRVLYEIGNRDQPTATLIAEQLALDPGYLSRILTKLAKLRIIDRKPGKDARQSRLSLTGQGRSAFRSLDALANREVAAMLSPLPVQDQARMIHSMQAVQSLLNPQPEPKTAYLLRPHQPGDIGWIIHRHGALYAQEYGWDERFEAEVAVIAALFIHYFDPKHERCWIAEKDGEIVGSIFLVRKSATVGQLRLFLVEPSARGLGIGNRLVSECVRLARQVGYRKITLWTQANLYAARHLFKKHGFQCVHRERQTSYGFRLTFETWELNL
jgi:DNA-binding MarR family transcriptional regulator/GNAT superfamily N-acetyltransferase